MNDSVFEKQKQASARGNQDALKRPLPKDKHHLGAHGSSVTYQRAKASQEASGYREKQHNKGSRVITPAKGDVSPKAESLWDRYERFRTRNAKDDAIIRDEMGVWTKHTVQDWTYVVKHLPSVMKGILSFATDPRVGRELAMQFALEGTKDTAVLMRGTHEARLRLKVDIGLNVASFFSPGALVRAGKAARLLSRFGVLSRAERGLHIAASSPAKIAHGYAEISERQAKILKKLPGTGKYVTLRKSDVSVMDLAALTAHTGDEFALFTLGSRRRIIRGSRRGLNITSDMRSELTTAGYRWSAHTHPGLTDNVLMASGRPGDRAALEIFTQSRSLILNSAGRRSIFDLDNDYLISKAIKRELGIKP